MIRLHDTFSREKVELVLRDPGRVSIYVCGPTVYEVPHVGHGRAGQSRRQAGVALAGLGRVPGPRP